VSFVDVYVEIEIWSGSTQETQAAMRSKAFCPKAIRCCGGSIFDLAPTDADWKLGKLLTVSARQRHTGK
jgi:hypothetical protein